MNVVVEYRPDWKFYQEWAEDFDWSLVGTILVFDVSETKEGGFVITLIYKDPTP